MRISHIAIFIALFAVFSIFATHVVAQESSSSSSDSSSKTLSKLELYQQWLLQNGAQLDNIKFTKLKGHGTTVVTTSELGVRIHICCDRFNPKSTRRQPACTNPIEIYINREVNV